MENASKALIMAAEILVSIMVISIGVFVFNEMGQYSAETTQDMEATQIAQFNTQFTQYYGSITTYDDAGNVESQSPIPCTIHDIVGLANLAKQVNYENGYELIPIKHLISFCNYFNIRVDEIFNFNIQEQLPINKEFDVKIVGKRLKEWRKKNKITQDKLAKMLNTNKSVICNYEKGRYLIATPFLYQICHQYHVSADYLLGRIDNDSQK